MAHAVSRRPLTATAEARVRSRRSPCGICGRHSETGTGFFPEYFGFHVSISFHRCYITEKRKKLIIFVTGLYNKPSSCGAYVASAAGPFTTKKPFLRLAYLTNIGLLFVSHLLSIKVTQVMAITNSHDSFTRLDVLPRALSECEFLSSKPVVGTT